MSERDVGAHDALQPVRVAVLGYGYWGPKHVRVLRQLRNVEVSIVDPDPERRALATHLQPGSRVTGDFDEIADDVDAVVVATPVRTHATLALDALDAGKDVLVEKPLAASDAECTTMIERAARRGAVLMTGHTFQYNAAVLRLHDIMHSGGLGNVYYIDAARLNLGIFQPDVNVLWDLAPHDLSILNYLTGRMPDEITAWGHGHLRRDREDVAYLRLAYGEPDMMAYVRVSWLDPCKVRRVTVVGSDKMVVYNDISVTERLRIYDAKVNLCDDEGEGVEQMPLTYHYGDIVTPFVAFEEPLAVQDQHFIDCVRTRTRPLTDGEAGRAVVRLLEAASRSLCTGRPVRFDADASR